MFPNFLVFICCIFYYTAKLLPYAHLIVTIFGDKFREIGITYRVYVNFE